MKWNGSASAALGGLSNSILNKLFIASCRRTLSFNDASGIRNTKKRQKTAFVLGSSGALGSAISRYLSEVMKMNVLGADIVNIPAKSSDGWELDGFVSLPANAQLPELTERLTQGVHEYLTNVDKENFDPETGEDLRGLDCIVVASGGWEGDPPMTPIDKDQMLPDEQLTFLSQAAQNYTRSIVRMREKNLDPVIAAGFIAQHMASDHHPLMVVMGATAALLPTPSMMGYGLAKSAAHHFVQTMGAMNGNKLEHKALRKRGEAAQPPHLFPHITVVGILPTTLDTPSNREAMPNGKYELWTKPTDIAKEIGGWVESPMLRPHSGSLVKVFARKDGEGSNFELAY